MRGGLTITAAAPSAFASRLYSMQVRTPSADAPTMTFARPSTCAHDRLDHERALAFVQPRDFARHAERRHAVHAGPDNQIDDALQALDVDVAAAAKRRRQHGIHAFKRHANPSRTNGKRIMFRTTVTIRIRRVTIGLRRVRRKRSHAVIFSD